MKKLLKIFLWIIGVFATLFVIFILIGFLASKDYNGSKTEVINSSAGTLWNHLYDIENLPRERPEIKKIEVLEANGEEIVSWKEYTDMDGYIIFRKLEEDSLRKLKLQMVESTFGMTGVWTYVLKPVSEAKTEVTISEESKIDNLAVRSIMAVAGRNANIEKELEILRNTAR